MASLTYKGRIPDCIQVISGPGLLDISEPETLMASWIDQGHGLPYTLVLGLLGFDPGCLLSTVPLMVVPRSALATNRWGLVWSVPPCV